MNIDDNATEIYNIDETSSAFRKRLKSRGSNQNGTASFINNAEQYRHIEERMERRINYIYDVMECIISII